MSQNENDLLWPNWIDFIKGRRRCTFIAQGTLINKHSIGKTIGRAKIEGPVEALGVRRIFNFTLMDENYKEQGGHYERSEEASHRATLNIVDTENPQDKVNGVLFSISSDDIEPLAQREHGYDVIPVEYRRRNEKASAFMFIARKESQTIGHRVSDEILPNESSLKICLTGAATYGDAFVDAWIASCYLADGRPLMKDPYYEDFVRELLKTL